MLHAPDEQRIREVLDAPFKRCPEKRCDHGWIEHWDFANASHWWEMCPTCEGTGQVLPLLEPEFVTRIRKWFFAKRKWFYGIAWALGVALLLLVLAADLILGWAL